jgi:hypothetical protein
MAKGWEVPDISSHSDNTPTECLDLLAGPVQVIGSGHRVWHRLNLLGNIECNDVCAVTSQPHRMSPALPPRGPGDHGDSARKRLSQLSDLH